MVEDVARELIRALRGPRSQVQLSRRLGFRTNVVYRWEAGTRWPSGSELFVVAARTGADPARLLARFDPVAARIAAEAGEVGTDEHLAAWLRALTRTTSTTALARRAGIGRSAAQRALTGRSVPSLPVVLRIVDAVDGRMAELVGLFTAPEVLPSLRGPRVPRDVSARQPWTDAVIAALEIGDATVDAVAGRLELPLADVQAIVDGLAALGAAHRDGERVVLHPQRGEVAPGDPGWHREVTRFWAAHAAAPTGPTVARWCVVGALADADLEAVHALHRETQRRLRAIKERSVGEDRVVLLVHQVVALDGRPIRERP